MSKPTFDALPEHGDWGVITKLTIRNMHAACEYEVHSDGAGVSEEPGAHDAIYEALAVFALSGANSNG